jgi:osmotically-inducible protein OsmY
MTERYDNRDRGEGWQRERSRRDHEHDRGLLERAGDELRSWFGDEEAERRRRMDEARYGRDRIRYGREAGYGRDWRRYEREPERYGYGRDADYGPRMGFDYGRPRTEPGSSEERWSTGERDYSTVDYWRPGWPAHWNDPAYGGSAYTRTGSYRAGSFSGRGPRGYQRTDDRIREDVCERLTEDPWIDASDIEVTVRAAEVTLSGTVRERGDKRHAEDVAERVSGVREVRNNLRVTGSWESPPGREQTPTAGTTTAGTTSRR